MLFLLQRNGGIDYLIGGVGMYQMTLERNNTQEFRSIEECIEVMKNNGYKCRCIVFCENDIIYEQKIVINNEGKISVRPKKEVVKIWNNSFMIKKEWWYGCWTDYFGYDKK